MTLVVREDAQTARVVDLEQALYRVAPNSQLWFPAAAPDGSLNPASVFSGYAFIANPVAPTVRRVWWVERLLRDPIKDAELRRMVGEPAPIRKGDVVTIKNLPFSGTVVKVERDSCSVRVSLDSGDRLLTVLRTNLEVSQ
jgi:hypothetical protein